MKHKEVQVDTVTALTITLAVFIAVPIASFIVSLLMVKATMMNRMAARWEFFCGGK